MKKRILLVDDRSEIRKVTKLILSRNYEVKTAENGMKAIAELQNGYFPDLIISDLIMPELDGENLLKQVKASGSFQHIPVIILSSIDKSAVRVKLLKAGADDYLIKPFSPDELEVRIQKILK